MELQLRRGAPWGAKPSCGNWRRRGDNWLLGREAAWAVTEDERPGEFNSDLAGIRAGNFPSVPRFEVAAHRFKNFMKRIGPAAGDVLTKIMVNVATEAAKKGMGM
jgi:hypothetical protein